MPFSRPTLSALVTRVMAGIRSRLTAEQMRRSDAEVYGREIAGASHELHGHLQYISRQVIYDTAESDYLDRWASIWLTQPRLAATAAVGNFTFVGVNGTVIPAGTVLASAAGLEYETDAEVAIADGTALCAITASLAGAASNASAGTVLSISTPIPGITSEAVVDGSGLTSGTDQEDDASLRARLISRIQQPPHGGAGFDYVTWAKEVAGVTRAWVYPGELGAGTVTVRFVRDNDASAIPDGAEVLAVQEYIDVRRPVTADVYALAPIAVALDFTITLTPNTAAVKAAVEAELRDLLSREAEPAGTILLSHIREAISIAAGENNYVMTAPAADVAHGIGEIAVMGAITWL